MATPPEPHPRGGTPRSWSGRVAQARAAAAPAIDVQAAVRAAIAHEPREAAGADAWGEFARMFAEPRALAPGLAGVVAAVPAGWWVLHAAVARLDPAAKLLVCGGLPDWLAALVT